MNYKVNFQKAKRNYMVLTFDDEREKDGEKETYERTILVGMPKKRIFSALMDMQDIMEKKNEAQTEKEKNKANREIIEELYELVAKILSNNMTGEKITTEWVDEQFTTEELQTFFVQYVKFVNGEAADPN
ncbi:MAG: hypothetical protein HDR11_09695 [Lachnospiraceae bacterium]|nr:hypothetical protein [Lachnospiraceae bacterium]